MNLDERIKGLFYSVGLYPDYSKDVVAEQESVKQLIRDVLEYVKPEYAGFRDPEDAVDDIVEGVFLEALGDYNSQMEAKIKELGL